MEGLTPGVAVEYVQQLPGQVGFAEYTAFVSKIYGAHDPEAYPTESIEAGCDRHSESDVQLHVLTENAIMVKHSVPYSDEKLPHSWHWIAR